MFRQDFTCPALLKDPSRHVAYGAVTRSGRPFQTVRLYYQRTTGLIRVRSPLLAESRLMSFPPGTEMFQFPGFASTTYVFSCRYPIGVGCPIRIPTDQRLLAAPRGFSQRATSFIASWCQGIHRMPLSRSRSLPIMRRSHPGAYTPRGLHPQPDNTVACRARIALPSRSRRACGRHSAHTQRI